MQHVSLEEGLLIARRRDVEAPDALNFHDHAPELLLDGIFEHKIVTYWVFVDHMLMSANKS